MVTLYSKYDPITKVQLESLAANQYYGTGPSGEAGFFTLPTSSGSGGSVSDYVNYETCTTAAQVDDALNSGVKKLYLKEGIYNLSNSYNAYSGLDIIGEEPPMEPNTGVIINYSGGFLASGLGSKTWVDATSVITGARSIEAVSAVNLSAGAVIVIGIMANIVASDVVSSTTIPLVFPIQSEAYTYADQDIEMTTYPNIMNNLRLKNLIINDEGASGNFNRFGGSNIVLDSCYFPNTNYRASDFGPIVNLDIINCHVENTGSNSGLSIRRSLNVRIHNLTGSCTTERLADIVDSYGIEISRINGGSLYVNGCRGVDIKDVNTDETDVASRAGLEISYCDHGIISNCEILNSYSTSGYGVELTNLKNFRISNITVPNIVNTSNKVSVSGLIDCTAENCDFFPTTGTTASRPAMPSGGLLNFQYYDTTLGKPIWWKQDGGDGWVDATGTTV